MIPISDRHPQPKPRGSFLDGLEVISPLEPRKSRQRLPPFKKIHSELQRQSGRILDLLHGKGRRNFGNFDTGNHFFVEDVVGGNIRNGDVQQIIDVARHTVKLDDF